MANTLTAFDCADCGVSTASGFDGIDEYYSLHDEVWHQVAPSGTPAAELATQLAEIRAYSGPPPYDMVLAYSLGVAGMLCVGCVEERLGRRLTPQDFSGAPINEGWFMPHSERLRSRIEGREERT